MRICVLESALPEESQDDFPATPARYLPEHRCEHHYIHKHSADAQLLALVDSGRHDLFINLCDGAGDDDSAGIEVVRALERLGVPFTGADSDFYDPSRETMKRVARACRIATPRGLTVHDLDDARRADRELRYPLIVKHPQSYASIGITRDSRVTTRAELCAEVERFLATFGGALVEEFIDGPEFTVLVAEHPDAAAPPVAFVPVRINFPAGETFKHYDLKWIEYGGMSWLPEADPALAERLKDMSRRFFLAIGGRSYGRCDIRMDRDGRLHLLEINPNCGIFYPPDEPGSADIILQHDPRGHRGFLDLIIASALRRARCRPAAARSHELRAV